MSKPFNINEYIWIKLKADGLKIYQDFYRNVFAGTTWKRPLRPAVDSDGYSKFQLWEFMQIYGPEMRMGVCNLSEGNNIYFDEPSPTTNKEN